MSVFFSPDGTQAVSGSTDNQVILWNVADAQPIRIFTGHRATVATVRFSLNGQSILSASSDNTIRQWRIDSESDLVAWAKANRYIPDLTCEQEKTYNLPLTHCAS